MSAPDEIRRYVSWRLEHLRVEEIRLRGLWNSATPINRLPHELFSMIVLELQADEDDGEESDDHWYATDGTNAWFSVGGVCRHWRNIVKSSPILFKNIHIKRGTGWGQLCFDCSGGPSGKAPVNVTIHVAKTLPAVRMLLSKNAHRIRRLVILDTDHNTELLLTELLHPSTNFALTELCIYAWDSRTNRACPGGLISIPYHPSLTTLRLAYAFIDWHAPVVRTLRAIHIRDCHSLPSLPTLSFDGFLRALQQCQALEELTVDFARPFDPFIGEDDDRGFSSYIVVTLPRIRKVHFLVPESDEPQSPELFHLLSHFRFQATTDVYLYSNIDDQTFTGRGGYLDTIPQDQSCLPILAAATSGSIRSYVFDVYLAGPSGHGCLGLFLDPFPAAQERWGYSLSQSLVDFCTLFSRAPMQELELRLEFEGMDGWRAVFRTFTRLRTLTLHGQGCKAPHERLRDAMRALQGVPGDTEGLPAPQLRTLNIGDVAWGGDVLRPLVECLRARAERSARLSWLLFKWTHQDAEDALVAQDGFMEELDSLVDGAVVCEDMELEIA